MLCRVVEQLVERGQGVSVMCFVELLVSRWSGARGEHNVLCRVVDQLVERRHGVSIMCFVELLISCWSGGKE